MVIITYHVQASHLPSYTSSLLETVQHQQDISLSSGDETVSVSSLLLRVTSPLLSSLLQSPCPCSQSAIIILPSCLSSSLPSLVSLLYTGYASNLSMDQVNRLKLLTKELGIETDLITESRQFETEILGVGFGSSSAEQLPSAIGSDFKSSLKDDLIDVDHVDISDVYNEGLVTIESKGCNNFSRKSLNNNQVIMSGHKRRRKFNLSEESVQNDEVSESDLLYMCPPVRPRISSGNHILVEPEDSILSDSILPSEVDGEFLEGEGNIVEGLDNNCGGGEKIEVVTIRDDEVYDDLGVEDDEAESLNLVSGENAIDPFCEIEIDSFALEDEVIDRQAGRFICKICDQAFVADHDFRAHLASTHYKSKLFEEFEKFGDCCPICNKKSRDTFANIEHIGEQHEKVYEYYEADRFIDMNSNWGRFNSKAHGRNHPNSSKTPPPLRGILKSTNSGTKEEPPKSILRTPSLKSPVPQHSILKLPKSSPKLHRKVILNREETNGEGGQRGVLLSVQDDVGDVMIDV